jgi:archaellum component FlaC
VIANKTLPPDNEVIRTLSLKITDIKNDISNLKSNPSKFSFRLALIQSKLEEVEKVCRTIKSSGFIALEQEIDLIYMNSELETLRKRANQCSFSSSSEWSSNTYSDSDYYHQPQFQNARRMDWG